MALIKVYIKNITDEIDDSVEAYRLRNEMRAYRKRQFLKAAAVTFIILIVMFISVIISEAEHVENEFQLWQQVRSLLTMLLFIALSAFFGWVVLFHSPGRQRFTLS